MEKFNYKSKFGIFEICYKNDTIFSLVLAETFLKEAKTPFEKKVEKQLDEYFSSSRKTFDLKINPIGTDFQKEVWDELLKVPYGKTKNYAEIAALIKHPNSQRAVGSACNKNPILILIPCHRIIKKNGEIGGFSFGCKLKKELLKLENNSF